MQRNGTHEWYAASSELGVTLRAGVQLRPQSKPSASEVTTLWRYTNMLIIMIIITNGLCITTTQPPKSCKYIDYYSLTDPGGMKD